MAGRVLMTAVDWVLIVVAAAFVVYQLTRRTGRS